MGRSKIPIAFIKKDKKRNTTYEKRKKGLLKKAYELATLCDVPLCVVVYPGSGSGSGLSPATWPEREEEVRAVIARYESGSREVNAKRSLSLKEGLELGKKKKVVEGQRHAGSQRHGGSTGGGNGGDVDGLSREKLVKMRSSLECKLGQVGERIRMAAGPGGGWNSATWQPEKGAVECVGGSSGGGDGGYECNPSLSMGSTSYCLGQAGPSAIMAGPSGGWPSATWQQEQVAVDYVGGSGGDDGYKGNPNLLLGSNFYGLGQVGPSAMMAGPGGGSSGGGGGGGGGGGYECNPNLLMGPTCYGLGQVGPSTVVKNEPYISEANYWYDQGKIYF